MSITTKYSRPITIEGVKYRWKVKDNGDHLGVSIQELDCEETLVYSFWPVFHDDPEQITPSIIKQIVKDRLIPRKKYISWSPRNKDLKRYKKMSYSQIAVDVWGQLSFTSNWTLEIVNDGCPLYVKVRSRHIKTDDKKGDISIRFKDRSDLPTECYIAFNVWFDNTNTPIQQSAEMNATSQHHLA